MRYEELTIEGRNAVLEAFRAGKPIDKLFVLDGFSRLPGKRKSTIRLSIMWQKSVWIRFPKQGSIRG